MYKVFFNDRIVFLNMSSVALQKYKPCVSVVSSVDELKKMMQIFFKEGEKFNLILNSAKGFDLAKAFESLFINIDAAGGLVLNAENNLLAIYRLGKWDLPKGKIHRNELAERAAIREIREECGITVSKVERFLGVTRHIYPSPNHSKKMVLKKTQWFQMSYRGKAPLVAQKEESIEEVRWVTVAEIPSLSENTYASIKDLFRYPLLLSGL
jgi:ADP-ribose pyrophosphatase YjhB (NUDIX family)